MCSVRTQIKAIESQNPQTQFPEKCSKYIRVKRGTLFRVKEIDSCQLDSPKRGPFLKKIDSCQPNSAHHRAGDYDSPWYYARSGRSASELQTRAVFGAQIGHGFVFFGFTAQHKGILAGLAILKLYCECLGTTWTGNSNRDPVVFFRTADMADASQWQRLPAEFDKDQAKAYSFTQPGHSVNLNSDRSSGLGPVNGRPP